MVMKRYYFFDFPLEMYGLALLFGSALVLIVYAAFRRAKRRR